MAYKTPDRVWDTTTSDGPGPFTVAGHAPKTYRAFADVIEDGDTFPGVVASRAIDEWQSGIYRFNADDEGGSIELVHFHASSTGAPLSFGVGTKNVKVTDLGRGQSAILRSADFTPLPGDNNDVDTSDGAIMATLPADPEEGDRFWFNDFAGTWGANAFSIDPNGAEFEDAGDGSNPAEPMICSDPAAFAVIFAGGKYRIR